MVSLAAYLLYKEPLGGVIGLSGIQALDTSLIPEGSGNMKTPIFLYHGLDDNTVPYERAKLTFETLGRDYELHAEDFLAHGISQLEIKMIGEWID